jgi:hypothetical protein
VHPPRGHYLSNLKVPINLAVSFLVNYAIDILQWLKISCVWNLVQKIGDNQYVTDGINVGICYFWCIYTIGLSNLSIHQNYMERFFFLDGTELKIFRLAERVFYHLNLENFKIWIAPVPVSYSGSIGWGPRVCISNI